MMMMGIALNVLLGSIRIIRVSVSLCLRIVMIMITITVPVSLAIQDI